MLTLRTYLIAIFLLGNVCSNAQMYQLGGNVSYFASQLLSKTMRYDGGDSTYVFTGGKSAGLTAALYFDKGGYYSKKVYGIKLESNFCQVDQSYKFFPGQGIIDPNVFYRYRIKLSYIDIPLMFTMCPTHHQGLTFEVGPQISFLNKASAVLEEYKNTSPVIPVVNTHTFNPTTFSIVAGAGLYYSFTETFALTTTFRALYGVSSLIKSGHSSTSISPDKRVSLGITAQLVYKINKYDAQKNRGYKYYARKNLRK